MKSGKAEYTSLIFPGPTRFGVAYRARNLSSWRGQDTWNDDVWAPSDHSISIVRSNRLSFSKTWSCYQFHRILPSDRPFVKISDRNYINEKARKFDVVLFSATCVAMKVCCLYPSAWCIFFRNFCRKHHPNVSNRLWPAFRLAILLDLNSVKFKPSFLSPFHQSSRDTLLRLDILQLKGFSIANQSFIVLEGIVNFQIP